MSSGGKLDRRGDRRRVARPALNREDPHLTEEAAGNAIEELGLAHPVHLPRPQSVGKREAVEVRFLVRTEDEPALGRDVPKTTRRRPEQDTEDRHADEQGDPVHKRPLSADPIGEDGQALLDRGFHLALLPGNRS